MKNIFPTTAIIDDQIAFLEAAQNGDIETLEELLEKNKDLAQTTLTQDIILRARKSDDLWSQKSLGFNALHYAFVSKQFIKVAEFLIDSDDKWLETVHPEVKEQYVRIIDSQDENLETVLHTAVKGEDVRMNYVNFLLTKNPDISKQNKDGNTALHLALKNLSLRGFDHTYKFGDKFLCATNLIALNDASQNLFINKTNKRGNTALHLAAYILKDYEDQKGSKIRGGQLINPEKEIKETLASLIKSGADISIKNKDKKTALQILQSLSNPREYQPIITLLGEEAVPVTIPKNKAIPSGEPKDINSFNEEGLTQLHIACRDGFPLDFVVSLLTRGANVNLVDEKNRDTALNHAIRFAINNNKIDIVKELISNYANPLTPNEKGNTSIHIACSFNNNDETNTAQEEVLESLLNAGVSVDAINGVDGMTPLQIASEKDSTSTMNLLIDKRANINYANNINGNTALHYAVIKNKHKAVKLLIKKGAQLDLTNIDGKTPKQIAIDKGFYEIAGLLSNASTQQQASTSLRQGSDAPPIIFPEVPSPTAPTIPTQDEPPVVLSALVLSQVTGDVYSYVAPGPIALVDQRPVTTSDTLTSQAPSEPPSPNPSCFSCFRVMVARLFVSNP